MSIICVTLILFVVILLYVYLIWNNNYWKKRGVKGPKPKLLLGTQPNAITQKRNMIYDYVDHYNKYKKTDKFIGAFMLRTPEIIVLTPDLVKQVYVTQFRKFQDNYFSHIFNVESEPIFGLNPFFLKGQEWKDKRAEITPALTGNRIKASYPIMQKVCSRMVDFIQAKNKVEGKDFVFNCKELTQRFTIENVSDCIYGIEAGAFNVNKMSDLLKQATALMEGLLSNFSILFLMGSIPFLTKIWNKRSVDPKIENFFTTLMEDAIELRKKTTSQADRVDFLNYIMQLKEKKGLSTIELQAHAITFFLDGFETSANVLAHSILCIGRNKEVQNKLRQEIEKKSNEDGTIDFDKLLELTYLNQCINETLRLFPPATFSQKICTEDTELTNSDGTVVQIKKGIPVTVPIYCLQNDEDYFPDNAVYNPERFRLENGGEKKYHDMGVFIPFGDGPRACLGQKFALLQIKIALCELVKNFEINVNNKTRKDNLLDPKNVLAYLDGGIWCSFKELKN